MTLVDLERTCTLIPRNGAPSRETVSKPLSEYRSESAYVLLGDPGAGKTTSFKREREHTPTAVEKVIDARDFITFETADHPEWRDRTLFIDGLDEIRAGSQDGRTALDSVRARLEALGRPRFRLSCREADWLGPNDWARLQAVAPGGELTVLRLDALKLDDVHRIIEASPLVASAERFIEEAGDRGLQELLFNPQTLELMIKAVGGAGQWPTSRLQTFELACRQLAREKNEEHSYSRRDQPGEDQILNDAGRICALLLLSGTPGVSQLPSGDEEHTDYPRIQRFDPIPEGMAPGESEIATRRRRLALSSRLFSVVGGNHPAGQRVEPLHRHIAEFLAGRYLAQQITASLPAARVIALITARDGGVVTVHRGLSAWLAAHSQAARTELVDRDPMGVGLYGDLSSFSTEEKQAVLLALLASGPQLHDLHWRNVRAFAPIVTPALEDAIHSKLTLNPRNDDEQHGTAFLLMLLSHAAPMPRLVEPILAILRSTAWWSRVRYWALDAFLCHSRGSSSGTRKLEELLADVYDGRLDDPDNRIAGAALEQLYPTVVSPGTVWRYLTRTKPSNYFGAHSLFWGRLAEEERSTDSDVAVLLDTLPKHTSELKAILDTYRLTTVAAQLLVRGLRTLGPELTQPRLYDWLSAPLECGSYADALDLREQKAKIAEWLECHPDAYKLAFREGLHRGATDDPPSRFTLGQRLLYGADPPSDFGSWCLDEAETLAGHQPVVAQWLFRYARARCLQGEVGLTQERLDECLRQHPSWQPEPEDPKAEQELQAAERRWRESKRAFNEQQEQEQKLWLAAVRREVPLLKKGRGAPWLLQRLAKGWLVRASNEAISLQDWLGEEFGPNEDLAAAARQGLRGVLNRLDMPEPEEILELHSESRVHRLSEPFLAALHERDQEQPTFVDQLTRRQQRQALALHYCRPTSWARRPTWYNRLVEQSPEVAASVLLPLARTQVQSGHDRVAGLRELAHDQHHAELARLVSLPLLRSFPVRGRATQSDDLCLLLWAALQRADREELRAVIAQKLAVRSMTDAQRASWLGAALLADPHTHAAGLEKFIAGTEQRARQVANFLWFKFFLRPEELRRPEAALPPQAVESLVRQLGRAGIFRSDFQHTPDPASGRLGSLIELLATSPEPGAAAALRRLADDDTLSEWRPTLLRAIDRQAVVGRDHSYVRPDLAAIRATLDNAAPANAADLAALALDRLDELAEAIRHANTNDWRQYWNEDTNGQPVSSKHEESCRDTLLSRLRFLLRDELHGQPEAAAAAKKRADIGLFGPNFHVPIEIKKQSNPGLWRAARDQLVAKYTQDPTTDGYGIYLVLWFGEQEKTPLDETGTRPESPDELQRRLEDNLAKQLPLEQRRKIGVRVIDVSKP